MSRTHQLGELQLEIMRVLWSAREATVAEVHVALQPRRELAPTTVATMLSKMEKKGVVDHRTEGRQFVYRPTVPEVDVHRSMVGDLTRKLFGGDPTALVHHLLNEQEIDPAELESIRRMVEASEMENGDLESGDAGEPA